LFFDKTYSCPKCALVFKSTELFISKAEEEKRYKTHQNSNNDVGYINFLSKLANPLREFINKEDNLLDYGCGPYSQLAQILQADVKATYVYDPVFFSDNAVNLEKYDVVTCTEVVEHFHSVNMEWDKLLATVKPNGILAIMTQFYHDERNYKDWWYKNDPTHVVFYREETLEFIAKKYGLKILYNDHRSVIILQNG
jgi:hypothetical protein